MSGRVLSVQSHVVYGYVGNKSATFPLQVSRLFSPSPVPPPSPFFSFLSSLFPSLPRPGRLSPSSSSLPLSFSLCTSATPTTATSLPFAAFRLVLALCLVKRTSVSLTSLTRRPRSYNALAPQVLGFDVDAVNSVHFSNHTGDVPAARPFSFPPGRLV